MKAVTFARSKPPLCTYKYRLNIDDAARSRLVPLAERWAWRLFPTWFACVWEAR